MDSTPKLEKQAIVKPIKSLEKLPLTPPVMKPGSLLRDTGQGDKTDEFDAWKTKRAE